MKSLAEPASLSLREQLCDEDIAEQLKQNGYVDPRIREQITKASSKGHTLSTMPFGQMYAGCELPQCPSGCPVGCAHGCALGCPSGCSNGCPNACVDGCSNGCPSGCPAACPNGCRTSNAFPD